MAVTEINDIHGRSFSVYVNLRSRHMPHIRYQKRMTKIKSKAEAQRLEVKLSRELALKVARAEGHGYTWRMVVMRWASEVSSDSYLEKTYSPSTVRDYVAMMNLWTGDWLDRPAAELTRGDGKVVLRNVIENGRSQSFQKRLKNTINMIFNWGVEEKVIRGVIMSPVYGLKIKGNSERKPEVLDVQQIRKLLRVAKETNHRWYPVWALALLTGMRNGELYSLTWKDIDFERRIINVERSFNFKFGITKSTKSGYWRTVPISSDLLCLFEDLKAFSKGDFVLPRLRQWRIGKQANELKLFCKEIDIPQVKFHTLRACFATQMLGNGIEPIKVMKICGWRDLKTLQIYLRLSGINEEGSTECLSFLGREEGGTI